MKTLILYVFHELNENMKIFLKSGIINDNKYKYIFISNGCLDFDLTLINKYPNIFLFMRENIGRDFGGWNDALFLSYRQLNNRILKKIDSTYTDYIYKYFDTFIFINSTVAGPYLPLYLNKNWIEYFTGKLSNKIKICGISCNFYNINDPNVYNKIYELFSFVPQNLSHIQSMIFSLDKTGLDILFKYNFFKQNRIFPSHHFDFIILTEISMSCIFRHEKYSLFSFLTTQGEITYDRKDNTEDFWYNYKYYDTNPTLYETIFVKTNRNIIFPEKKIYDNLLLTNK